MLGVQPAEMLMTAKAIGLVAFVVMCIYDPWWVRTIDWLRHVYPRPHLC